MQIKNFIKGDLHIILIKRLLIAYLLLTITRIAFYFFNYYYFRELSLGNLLLILWYGLRFDTLSIVIFNSLFIFLSIIPFKFRINSWYQKICKYLFIVVNSILLAANCIDIIYFRYTDKRSTFDIFNTVTDKDTSHLLPQFLMDFWYIALFWILLIVLMIFLYNTTRIGYKCYEKQKNILYYQWQSLLFILFAGMSVVGARGGFQYKPINIINAGEYTDIQYVPLVLNTPFTLIKTMHEESLRDVKYFSDLPMAEKIFSPYHPKNNHPASAFKHENVCIIIFEGLSKEHIGALNKDLDQGNYKGFTPFLDSLISESLVFDNAFANGKKSIEGIPAVIASIPTLMNTPYISSIYAGNKINSVASVLKKKGYTTSFYHGGKNGTMRFDAFAKFAGIENYYGKTEYNNDRDFDGTWGIWDEEFLQYTAKNINKTKEPFFASIFTLSSHHPYKVPERYMDKFPKGKLEVQQSIAYADFALKRFFQTASRMPWFDHTLFVITADHTSEAYNSVYLTRTGMYAVPVIFYKHKSDMKGFNHTVTQQADIMPTILDYLNYDGDYIAFGTDALDTTKTHFAVNYTNETYQIIEGDYSLIFDGNNTLSLFNRKSDPLLKKNLVSSDMKIQNEMERQLKAYLQSYNEHLIKNKLSAN